MDQEKDIDMSRINWCISLIIAILLVFINLSFASYAGERLRTNATINKILWNNSLSKKIAQPDKKRQSYNTHISKGDSLLKLKYYQSAMSEFQKAAELFPFEEYPRLQMQKIDAILGVKELEDKKRQETEEKEPDKEEVIQYNKEDIQEEPEKDKSIIAEQKVNDSLRNQVMEKYKSALQTVESAGTKQEKAQVYSNIADELKKIHDHSKAIEYYKESLKIEEEEGNKEKVAEVYENIAEVYLDSGSYNASIENLEKSAIIKQELGDEAGVSKVLDDIGKIYESTYNYQNALEILSRSLQVKKETDDKEGLSNVMDDMGNIYYKQQHLEKSIDSYKKSAELNEQLNNKEDVGATYNKMGVAYFEMGNYDEAEKYYQLSFDIKKNTGNEKEASMALNNLGNISYNQNKFKKAISFYENSLALKENSNYIFGKAVSLFNLGNAYRQVEAIPEAIKYYEACRSLSAENGFEELLARSLKILMQLYNKDKQADKADEYSKLLAVSPYQDVDVELQISESQVTGQADENQKIIYKLTEEVKRQKEIAEREAHKRARENQINVQRLKLKNVQIQRQKIILLSMIVVIMLVIGILGMIYYQMVQNKKANKALKEKNILISKQAKLIYDNIKSASAIQRAAMPPDVMMESELPQHFVLNMPKDIVSGDFYWMEKRDGTLFVAVADCTGHGVQGAVVSMLGMALLNEIVNKSFIARSGEILNQLSTKLKESLHASGDIAEIREGMDMVLCKFNKDLSSIEFAGANNPIYIVRNNDVIEYRGDRSPIGYYSKEVKFTNQNIKLQRGDSIYMFSDGYIDQLSGETYKKFLSKRFKNLIIEIDNLSMEERKNKMIKTYQKWKGTFQQVDDVMIMCIKV